MKRRSSFAVLAGALVVGCMMEPPSEADSPQKPTADQDAEEPVAASPEVPATEPNESAFLGGDDPHAPTLTAAATCSGQWAEGIKKKPGLGGDTVETSGFASSKRYPGWAWMIRDSSRPAILYAAKETSTGVFAINEHKVSGATNSDWEDVVYGEENGKGVLYILDTGKKLVYKVSEPDPNGSAAAPLLATYKYAFPDSVTGTCGPTNNAEAMLLFPPLTGKLHIVRKKSNPAGVYAFDSLSTTGTTTLKKVGDLKDASCISVASVSADGTLLVTASHGSMRVRKGTGTLSSLITGSIIFQSKASDGDSVEAGDFYPWGSCNITLAAEGRNTFTYGSK